MWTPYLLQLKVGTPTRWHPTSTITSEWGRTSISLPAWRGRGLTVKLMWRGTQKEWGKLLKVKKVRKTSNNLNLAKISTKEHANVIWKLALPNNATRRPTTITSMWGRPSISFPAWGCQANSRGGEDAQKLKRRCVVQQQPKKGATYQ